MGKKPPQSEVSRPLYGSRFESAKKVAAILGMSMLGVISPLPKSLTNGSVQTNISPAERMRKIKEANQSEAVKRHCTTSRSGISCALAHKDNGTRAAYEMGKNEQIQSEKTNHPDITLSGKTFEIHQTEEKLFVLVDKETREKFVIGNNLKKGIQKIKISHKSRQQPETRVGVSYPEASATTKDIK